MNVYIDIGHPAHVNLFKGLVNNYSNKFNFVITCIDRGKLPSIAREEFKNVPIHIVGKHKGSRTSIIFQANLLRFFQLSWFLKKYKIDIGLSFGSFLAGAILRLRGKPNIHLSDDPERKVNAILENLTCTARYLPPIVEESKKVKVFNALKEWSYLSPDYFTPNKSSLEFYNIEPKKYIFVREVSTGSLNYTFQEKNIIAAYAHDFPDDYTVILSIEDKHTRDQYPEHWQVLEEPVNDIHSLIFYSAITISSGDSIAREGAMLGVPSIYCGFREMKANRLLMHKKMLFHAKPEKVSLLIKQILKNEIKIQEQNSFRLNLRNEWADVNNFLIKSVNKAVNGN